MLTVPGLYWRLNLAMAIPVIGGVSRGGPVAVWMLITALLVAALMEAALAIGSGRKPDGIGNGRCVAIGLFVVAMSAPGAGVAYTGFAAASAVLIGVHLIGGPGHYWLHPAFVGLAIASMIIPDAATGSGLLTETVQSGRLTGPAAELLGRLVFEPLAIRIPPEVWVRLTSLVAVPGAAIVTGVIPLVLLASVIVYGEDLVPIVVPLLVMTVFVLLAAILGPGRVRGAETGPMSALVDGSILFAVVFGLAEPGTRPRSMSGIIAFGIVLGTLLALFSHNQSVTSPALAAFLCAGTLVPLLNHRLVPRR
jgi:Na+-translocating ferredoxin:NAD+ oxidoreductase RnfD subunit